MKRIAPILMVLAVACSDAPGAIETATTYAAEATAVAAVDTRIPVILDYSPTVSDIGALALLASHPDVRLVAVTLPGTGESYCEPGVAHTRGVLVELGLPDVPVACGPDDPLTGWNAFPTSWRVGSSEMDLPVASPNETRSAPELLTDLIRESEAAIEIVAVGPLTNLAIAFENDPGVASLLGGITIMGGAVDVPGNATRNKVGEWNIWVDPTAAGIVFASGAPITLVPLDATNHLPANTTFFEALNGATATSAATLVRDTIEANPFWLAGEGFYFWDELAAAVIVDPSLVTFEIRTLVVDDTTRENKGWTRQDPGGFPVRVAVTADRRRFEQRYLDTLVGEATDLGYLSATQAEVRYLTEASQAAAEADSAQSAIFDETARRLDVADSDDGFLLVVAAAVPEILAGPWQQWIEALTALKPPASLAPAHTDFVVALSSVIEHGADLIVAANDGDFEAFDELFGEVEAACLVLQEAVDVRLLDLPQFCF